MGDYGVKVTVSGKDVSSTDIRDYVFHSSYKNLKMQTLGTASITYAGGSTGSIVIPHSLGYAPLYKVFAEIHSAPQTNNWYDVGAYNSILMGTYAVSIAASTDATNLIIGLYSVQGGLSLPVNISYFLIIDPK